MMLATSHAVPQRRFSRRERRQMTIETTLASLARHGMEGTSLRSVCRDMGVAPSLITHSFSGWHDILAAAYDQLAERFLARLSPLLVEDFPDEKQRMRAVIGAYLASDWSGDNTIGAIVAFWRMSRTVPELRAPFGRFLEDRHQLLRQAVELLAEEAGADIDADDVTAAFILMMDGIWLHVSLDPTAIAAQRAQAISWAWIVDRLGQPAWRHEIAYAEIEAAMLH